MLLSIPHPRTVESLTGALPLARLSTIFLPPDATGQDQATCRLIQREVRRCDGRVLSVMRAWRPVDPAGVIAIGSPAAISRALDGTHPDFPIMADNPEAYGLVIGPQSVYLLGETPVGRLWATQTFRQLLRVQGASLPQVRVNDAPAMRYRGVLLDVARRKVPQVSTLKALVDTLSLLKINMLQLQVEHTFRFRRHPLIGRGCGCLTCDDLLELDGYCRMRGIELVPMLQSFGHMRNILMLDEYRHLAENPELQWSLCPTDPASLQFMDELYEEFLPCFSSNLVNIGCDETIDLGRPGGRSNAALVEKGRGRVYLDYVLGLHQLLTEKYGKQVMCWGDMLLHHPELLPQVPRDMIMLSWWYNPLPHYHQVDIFAQAGLQQIVCPGTGSWGEVFARVNVSWANVDQMARDGKAVGALGMLNTDWGDGGHHNLLGNSFYSFAHSAEAGWAVEPMPRPTFDAILGPAIFGQDGEDIVAAINTLGADCDQSPMLVNDASQTVAMLFTSPMESPQLRELSPEQLVTTATDGMEAGTLLHNLADASLESSAVEDMAWSADALAYAARKTLFLLDVMKIAEGAGSVSDLLATCEDLLAEHEATVSAFQERWHAGNRHSEIDVALGRFAHALDVLHIVQHWLLEHRDILGQGHAIVLPTVPAYQAPWKDDGGSLWTPESMAEHVAALGATE